MEMFNLREGDRSNRVIGIILLVMLLVYIGPTLLPQVLSNTFPFIEEGTPCSLLRQSKDRTIHQSLIGRAATSPLRLQVTVEPLPPGNNGNLTIRIFLINESIGAIPIIYAPDQVIVNDASNSSGVGIVFEPQVSLETGNLRQNVGVDTFPTEAIRILGPRQRCVHRLDFPVSELDNVIINGGATVRAYYRITAPGNITQSEPDPIYNDQGLAIVNEDSVGILTSDPVRIVGSALAN